MRYDHGDVSFDLPPGYDRRSSVTFADARGTTSLAVSRGPLAPGDTLRRIVDANVVALGKQREGLVLERSGPRVVGGVRAWEIACAWPSSAGVVVQRMVLVDAGEQIVGVVASGAKENVAQVEAALAHVLASLSTRGGVPATPASSPSFASSPPPARRPRSTRMMEAIPAMTTMPPPASATIPVVARAPGFAPSGPSPAERQAAELAASHWQCDVKALATQDLAVRLPWVVRHHVVSVRSPEGKWLISATGTGTPLLFDAERRVASLNHLLRVEQLRLPSDLDPTELADMLLVFLLGPAAGFVGCPQLLASQRPHFARWLAPPYDEAERLFIQHCDGPRLTEREPMWTLDFSLFNARGGVDVLRAIGDTQHVRTLDASPAVKEGRLHFPFAA